MPKQLPASQNTPIKQAGGFVDFWPRQLDGVNSEPRQVYHIRTAHHVVKKKDLNHMSTMHGGRINYLLDDVGGNAAIDFARCKCATKHFQSEFIRPIRAGDVLDVKAEVRLAEGSRVYVEISIYFDGQRMAAGLAAKGYMLLVAVSGHGKPIRIPQAAMEIVAMEDRRNTGKLFLEG